VYPLSVEREGLVGSLYCWGCGFSCDALGLVKEVRGLSWGDTFEYVRREYGVEFVGEFSGGSNELIEVINILKYNRAFVERHLDYLSGCVAVGDIGGMLKFGGVR
jgi:hypothetical protein